MLGERTRWPNGVTDSMDVNSGELRETVRGRDARRAPVHGSQGHGDGAERLRQQVRRETPRRRCRRSPARPPAHAGLASLRPRPVSPSRGRGLSLGLFWGWLRARGVQGAWERGAEERLLSAVSPPPAQRRFRQQPRSGVALSGAAAGRASLLAAGEVKALVFPVWEFGCVSVHSATGPSARRPGRAVPVHPAARSSRRARYPCARSPQRAAGCRRRRLACIHTAT